MELRMKRKYLIPGSLRRGSKNSTQGQGKKGSKNLDHPIGFSGRAAGKLQRNFRPPNKKAGAK